MRRVSDVAVSTGSGQTDKVVKFGHEGRGLDSPAGSQLPQSAALCWSRPSSQKLMHIVVLLIKVKDKTIKTERGTNTNGQRRPSGPVY